ncbi:cyclic nucleotide-binding domain-containing protein [Agitococcus lubricus]|uniref:CRP-like cAMP-binding protein n=1 Tax=Agitococcus lubricus TaxID=1077255 RepID=A0A2T5IZM6_9GAMM|nr:cyclic nucleotide-binding domain-containing protein [Agitococcus lubricus]PTQ89493.1 CRP-like cAMP-binding protein [Agitococcus lubricus]
MITSKTLALDVLHNFVPLNALSAQRLKDVVSGCYVESLPPESIICRYGECDDKTVFLLSGTVALIDHHGQQTLLNAIQPAANYALVDSRPRQFTIKSHTPINILTVNQQRLHDALVWEQSLSSLAKALFANLPPSMDKEWVLHLLQSHIFYRLPPMNILELLNALIEVPVKKGQKVISMGDKADCCYFIKSGRAEVKQLDHNEVLTVAYLGTGGFFGEEGLLKNAPRNADVVMLEDGLLMRLEQKDFDRLLRAPSVQSMSFSLAQAVVNSQEAVWLDIRLLEEYQLIHLKGAMHLSLADIRLKARQLPLNKHYIVCCDNGQRSAAAAFLLGIQGYNASVLAGGLWSLSATERAQYLEAA